MARLIEVQFTPERPISLVLTVGDVLQFAATGGRVRSGPVQMLGPFRGAVLGDNGEIFTPAGAPNIVFFVCGAAGRATIEVVTGDPWHAPDGTSIEISIQA